MTAPESSTPADPCHGPFVAAATSTGLVPPNPTSALVCTPSGASDRRNPLPGRLTQVGATMLAAIFNASAPAATPCTGDLGAVVRFSYPSGPEADVRTAAPQCAMPTASAGSRSVQLNHSLALFLSDDSTASGAGGGSSPDVTGVNRDQAAIIGARAGLAIDIEGQVVDSAVPANTVVLQFPPAGSAIDGATIGLLLSQQPAPACTPDQLLVKVDGIQDGGGGDFDSFEISDTSASACTLVDQLRVVGLDATGKSETNTLTWTPEAEFVLTANTPPRTTSSDTIGATRADLLLQGAIFYGPNPDGSCTGLWVTPASWSITVAGATRILRNGDGAPQTTFTACQGHLFPDPSTPLYPTP